MCEKVCALAHTSRRVRSRQLRRARVRIIVFLFDRKGNFLSNKKTAPISGNCLNQEERQTGLEPATSTLARWRTTNCTTVAFTFRCVSATKFIISYVFIKCKHFFHFFYIFMKKKLPLLHITQLTYPVLHPSQNESRRNIPAAFVSALLQNLAVVMSSTHIFRIAQRSAIVFQPRLLAGNRMLHSCRMVAATNRCYCKLYISKPLSHRNIQMHKTKQDHIMKPASNPLLRRLFLRQIRYDQQKKNCCCKNHHWSSHMLTLFSQSCANRDPVFLMCLLSL